MAKELPFFKFEPQEYLSGDISFCSLEAQGFFIVLCSHYWTRLGKLTKSQILRRLDRSDLLNELLDEGVIKIDSETENISILFMDEQIKERLALSHTNSKNGRKGGRPKKTEKKPNGFKSESETKAKQKAIEEKRREEKRKEEIKETPSPLVLDSKKNEVFNQWLKYRKEIKKQIKSGSTMDRLAKKFNMESLEKCTFVVNLSIENGWTGLFWDRYTSTNNRQQTTNTSGNGINLSDVIKKLK